MRVRLRPTPDQATLERLYAVPHRHAQFPDHRIRVDVTTALAGHLLREGGVVADLSCGDATVARRLERSHGARLILGDLAPGYDLCGPIEQTLDKLGDREADLLLCCETLEHLDDPDAVLGRLRGKCDRLLVSTPDGEQDDHNPEHVWGWDSDAVAAMLAAAGFTPVAHTLLDLTPAGFEYCFAIFGCV